MWRWQQLLEQLNNLSLGAKVIAASSAMHACALFLLLIVYNDRATYKITISQTMINTDVPIVFMPLYKSMAQKSALSSRGNNKNNAPSPSVQKKEKVTMLAKLPEKKIINKKAANKKNPQQKKEIKPAAVHKNEADKQIASQPKKEITKVIENKQKQEIILPVVREIKPENVKQIETSSQENVENVLYVGQQEMDALQLQNYIQEEMCQLWQPPPGMRKELSCLVKIKIDQKGIVDEVTVEQSSGAVIFDSAACDAATKLTPPRFAYGKEIIITFKP